jgi:hypothetical protein
LPVADANSGIDIASLLIKENLIVNGQAATEHRIKRANYTDTRKDFSNQPLPTDDATERHILAEISAYLVHMGLTGHKRFISSELLGQLVA